MAVDAALVQLIEEISTNALPTDETLYYDGWILRFSNQLPRRANAVHLFYDSTLPLDEKIDFCEKMYWSRGWRVIFKLTPNTPHAVIDNLLARGGYSEDDAQIRVSDTLPVLDVPPHLDIEINPMLTPSWLADKQRLHAYDDAMTANYGKLLSKLVTPAAFVRICQDGRAVAVGLGVVERGWMGLYSLITDPTVRRQGLATAVIGTLFEWARGQGATRAYLQVSAANEKAQNLYEKLGFYYAYRYWYLEKYPPKANP